jgi:hypothetical protein
MFYIVLVSSQGSIVSNPSAMPTTNLIKLYF